MSLIKATEQILNFLHSENPEIIAIRGKWGTGKTFLWNKYFLQESMSNKISLPLYSYVSLFGVKSAEELKEKISESLTPIPSVINNQNRISILGNMIDKFSRKSSKITSTLIDNYLSNHNIKSNILPALQKLLFLSVEKSIIILDDFERKNSLFMANDILGLISNLKEQRRCKLVLIFNDEELDNTDKITYQKLREKVIDKEIIFSPTPEECADIVLKDTFIQRILRDLTIKLGIKNIRILNKIKCLAEDLMSIINDQPDNIKYDALHSLALYAYCYYAPHDSLPTLEILESLKFGYSYNNNDNKSNDSRWITTLQNYNYQDTNDFDRTILLGVKYGYFDSSELLVQANLLASNSKKYQAKDDFSQSFNIVRDSLANNQNEVIDSISSSFNKNISYLSIYELNSAVTLFRELDEESKADKLIDNYIETHKLNPDVLDIDLTLPYAKLDNKLVMRLKDIQKIEEKQHSLEDIFKSIKQKSSWSKKDDFIIKNSSENDLYELIIQAKGDDLRTIISYGKSIIPDKIKSVLLRISKESKINQLRLLQYLT